MGRNAVQSRPRLAAGDGPLLTLPRADRSGYAYLDNEIVPPTRQDLPSNHKTIMLSLDHTAHPASVLCIAGG